MTAQDTRQVRLWVAVLVTAVGAALVAGYWPLASLFAGMTGGPPPFHPMSPAEQGMVAMTACVITPLCLILALAGIRALWGRPEPDLAAIRWGLAAFFLGETGAMVNGLLCKGGSDFWEFTHNYGMAVGFSLVVYGLIEGADRRFLKMGRPSDPCAAAGLCPACNGTGAGRCALRRLLVAMVPALFVVSLLPLTAGFRLIRYQTGVLGSIQTCTHLLSSQWFENGFCPVWSCLALAASWFALRSRRDGAWALGKMFVAAAVGPLTLGILRLFLSAAFSDRLWWMGFWEQTTQLLFLAGLGWGLWVFRPVLLAPAGPLLAATRKPL